MKTVRFLSLTFVAIVLGASLRSELALTREEAWRRAWARAPERSLLVEERATLSIEKEVAGRPAPAEIGLEVENVLGSGRSRGVDDTEATLEYRRLWERGDKRRARQLLAESALPLAEAEAAERLAGLRGQVYRAFTAALAARDRALLREEAAALARESVLSSQRQYEAGQLDGIDLSRVRLEQVSTQAAARSAATEAELARQVLSRFWDGERESFSVAGELVLHERVPEWNALAERLVRAPEQLRLEAEGRRREAQVAWAKAEARIDATLSVGVRGYREEKAAAFVVGVSFPWKSAAYRRGPVRAAQARARQLPHERERLQRLLTSELAALHAELFSAQEEATLLAGEVLPAADDLVRRSEAAFAAGQGTLVSLLDARRARLSLRERQLDAVTRGRQALDALETLVVVPEPPAYDP